ELHAGAHPIAGDPPARLSTAPHSSMKTADHAPAGRRPTTFQPAARLSVDPHRHQRRVRSVSDRTRPNSTSEMPNDPPPAERERWIEAKAHAAMSIRGRGRSSLP